MAGNKNSGNHGARLPDLARLALTRLVAENLTELRRTSGLSRAEVGDRIRCSPATLQKYEEGQALPPLFFLYQIAAVYSVGWMTILPNVSEVRDGS